MSDKDIEITKLRKFANLLAKLDDKFVSELIMRDGRFYDLDGRGCLRAFLDESGYISYDYLTLEMASKLGQSDNPSTAAAYEMIYQKLLKYDHEKNIYFEIQDESGLNFFCSLDKSDKIIRVLFYNFADIKAGRKDTLLSYAELIEDLMQDKESGGDLYNFSLN